MNTLPIACSLALASMSAAVASHWWSLGQFSTHLANAPRLASPQPPLCTPPGPPNQPALPPAPAPPDPKAIACLPAPPPTATPAPAEKEFFESLLDEMRQLKKTNLALRDQMAETNRDLMKLEFRVDTQSASFRPLPITEEVSSLDTSSLDTSSLDTSSLDTSSLDTSSQGSAPSVLPPRAVVVGKPDLE
jgi:hypothetical protein